MMDWNIVYREWFIICDNFDWEYEGVWCIDMRLFVEYGLLFWIKVNCSDWAREGNQGNDNVLEFINY